MIVGIDWFGRFQPGIRRNLAVGILGAADKIRGFGHVKERNLEEYRVREAELLAEYERFAKKQEREMEEYA